MIVDAQMDQFMDDYVLNQGCFQHHHTPVEPQRAVWGATSPALALVPDKYLRFAAVAQTGPPTLNAGPQAFFCPASVLVNNHPVDSLIALRFFQTIGY